MNGQVSEITNFSTHDGPGIRTTVFLMGCPLRCKWCSNPETFLQKKQLYYIAKKCQGCGKCEIVCPQNAISSQYASSTRINREKCSLCFDCVRCCAHGAYKVSGKQYSVEELVAVVEKDKVFYGKDGGITISGGEPLEQAAFTQEVFRNCKERGISTVLDTSGFGNTEALEEILTYTDLVLLDLKHMESKQHQEWTGVGNECILKNAEIIASRCKTRISLPLIPDVNDSSDNIHATADFAVKLGVEWVDVNPFHTLGSGKYRYLGLEPPFDQFRELGKAEIDDACKIFKSYGLKTTIGRMM